MADYRFVVKWQLTGDDIRQTGFHFTAAAAADEAIVEAAFDAVWTAIKPWYKASTVLAQYAWYEGLEAVNDPDYPDTNPQKRWGDTFRTTSRSVAGTETNPAMHQLPPQCAIVVTHRLPLSVRRHQGRSYFPAPSATKLAAGGYFNDTDVLADTMVAFWNACEAGAWTPVIPSVSAGTLAFLPFVSLKVDNVFDTQRRRGYEIPTFTAVRNFS